MNLDQLREGGWNLLGYTQSGQRNNALRQVMDNAINRAIDRIKRQAHWWWNDIEIGTIAIVAGTQVYGLDRKSVV